MLRRTLSLILTTVLVSGLLGGLLCGCVARDTKVPSKEAISIGACNPSPCARIQVSDQTDLRSVLAPTAYENVRRAVEEVLYAAIDDGARELSLSSLRSQIEARQNEFEKGVLSAAPLDWQLERSATVLFVGDQVLTIAVTNIGYLGGAHGFNERTLLCFQVRDGKRLALSDLIDVESSKEILGRIAEAELRTSRGMSPNRSLQEEGFFIMPGDQFPLSENFGVVGNGVLLHYNPYDIAPYVMGAVEFVLPREAVLPLLREGAMQSERLFDAAGAR